MSPFPQIHTNTKKNAIGDLDGEHLKILLRAINRVLSTEIAEVSYTQIVDGLPLADVARETISPYIPINHPIYGHKKLCPQVWEKVRQFRESFDPATLQIEAPVSYQTRYQDGSNYFNVIRSFCVPTDLLRPGLGCFCPD